MKSQLCSRCNKPPGRMKEWKRRVSDDELEIYKAFIGKKELTSELICNGCNTAFWRFKQQLNSQVYKGVQNGIVTKVCSKALL